MIFAFIWSKLWNRTWVASISSTAVWATPIIARCLPMLLSSAFIALLQKPLPEAGAAHGGLHRAVKKFPVAAAVAPGQNHVTQILPQFVVQPATVAEGCWFAVPQGEKQRTEFVALASLVTHGEHQPLECWPRQLHCGTLLANHGLEP